VRFGRRIRRTRQGDFEVHLPEGERRVLASLVPQLQGLLAGGAGAEDDPSLRRLFPTAYAHDPDREAEYRQLVGDELLERRRAALDTVAATADATRLTEDELVAWMGAVNDLRLVLGTRLDVSEETDTEVPPDHPDAAAYAIYGYLGYLLENLVEALSEALP
jgi:hypothetical protein